MLDQQAIETMRPFDGPIAGQSLTNSPESTQPFEGPPEYTNIREATQAIFMSLLEDEMIMEVWRMMSNGTPIGDITKMLLVAGLSQGKFNADLMVLLVEPVMYMLLAIAEKVGIKNVKIDADDSDLLPNDQERATAELSEDASLRNEMRNPQRFSDLKVNISPDQIDQELINELENIDVAGIRQSLMARPQQTEMTDESLMARR